MREVFALLVGLLREAGRRHPRPQDPPLPPVVRVERLGSRLSDIVPTPEELEATEAILAETRELLSTERTDV